MKLKLTDKIEVNENEAVVLFEKGIWTVYAAPFVLDDGPEYARRCVPVI